MKAVKGDNQSKRLSRILSQSGKLRQSGKSSQSLILFTRLPILGKTKTRLVPHIGEEGALQVHWAILKDFSALWKKLERKEKSVSLLLFYDIPRGIAKEQWETALNCLKTLFPKASFQRQEGKDIFDKMENAFRYSFSLGSSFSYLVGADIPFMEKAHFQRVFALGRKGRQVLGASLDEGYYGIGLQRRIEPELLHACFSYQAVQKNRTILAASSLRNGRSMPEGKAKRPAQKESPFSYTRKILEESPIPLSLLEKKRDVDEGEDLNAYRSMLPYDKALRKSSFGEALAENAKISVIIPCYKEGRLVRRMEKQLRPYKKDLEILFVDGGENHFSGEYRVIPSKKGRAIQMNLGAEESTGDILFFLHCDSILPKGFVREIREGIKHSLAGCLGIRFKSSSPLMHICSFISNHRVLDRRVMFGDQGIFVDRDCFFAMGEFPILPLMEDYQFSLNLKKQGIVPYLAKKRIITSDRRFQGNFVQKLSLMWKMNRLRARYRKGEDIEQLAKEYRDIR
ncbi:TIGR04283 family arsenosugar biosynthesis glycosyltransferase [Oribacterium sinus]